jgi:MoaD family protein
LSIKVNIPRFLRGYTGQVKATGVEGSTIGECLEALVRQFPRLKKELFDRNGNLRSYLTIWVNQEGTNSTELTVSLKEGDELDILPVIIGG